MYRAPRIPEAVCICQVSHILSCGTVGAATQTGKAVGALQDLLPNARVLYSSATGASEPNNLGYMYRLGASGFDHMKELIETLNRYCHVLPENLSALMCLDVHLHAFKFPVILHFPHPRSNCALLSSWSKPTCASTASAFWHTVSVLAET